MGEPWTMQQRMRYRRSNMPFQVPQVPLKEVGCFPGIKQALAELLAPIHKNRAILALIPKRCLVRFRLEDGK